MGDSSPGTISYKTNLTNEFGEIMSKSIPRPDLCDFRFGFLPVISNHNKSHQHYLKLEKKWPTTKDCWFRLFCTLLGMSVVDWTRSIGFTVVQFSDIICNGLKQQQQQQQQRILPAKLQSEASKSRLKQIGIEDGNTTKIMTKGLAWVNTTVPVLGVPCRSHVGCAPNIKVSTASPLHFNVPPAGLPCAFPTSLLGLLFMTDSHLAWTITLEQSR
jgi:hypothetical protein